MNEELKPSALSSERCTRKRQARRSSRLCEPMDDLNNFLIRRQLLEMEGKRINEVLAEAEAELKNRQDRLIGVRDGASSSLRDHLDQHRRTGSGRQQAQVGSLENLPRSGRALRSPRCKGAFRVPETPSRGVDRPRIR